jgi:hypothetical protein
VDVDLIVERSAGVGLVKLGMTRQEAESLRVDVWDDRFRVHFDDEVTLPKETHEKSQA